MRARRRCYAIRLPRNDFAQLCARHRRGGLVGALFTSLTPFDEEEFFMKLTGQDGRVAKVVKDHFRERADRARWNRAYAELVGDEAVEWPKARFMQDLSANPVRAVATKVRVTELSSKRATVAITGTKWWRKKGCQLFSGTFTLVRDGGFWLAGGSWKISGKGGGARSLRAEEIPDDWDCRSPGRKLRDNERPIAPSSVSVKGSNTVAEYPATNVVDNNPATAWVANDPVANDHSWLDVYLPKPSQVVRIDVKSGFGSDTGPEWIKYDRAERVTLVNNHRESFVRRLDARGSEWQHLFMAFSGRTTAIRLHVDTYRNCQEGLAISEIRVIGVKEPEDEATRRLRAAKTGPQKTEGPVDCVPPPSVDPASPPVG
jgi:hypothetical protein